MSTGKKAALDVEIDNHLESRVCHLISDFNTIVSNIPERLLSRRISRAFEGGCGAFPALGSAKARFAPKLLRATQHRHGTRGIGCAIPLGAQNRFDNRPVALGLC
jgi:hypothetical protein